MKVQKIRKKLICSTMMNGSMKYHFVGRLARYDEEEALEIQISNFNSNKEKYVYTELKKRLDQNSIEWLYENENNWFLNLDKLIELFPGFLDLKWLTKGNIQISPEIVTNQKEVFGKLKDEVSIIIEVTEEHTMNYQPRKIFLSHKGINKPIVSDFYEVLKTMGFDPWLDEKAMVAGSNLERELKKGFNDSCAAIFFITPDYKDENYLATEIDYAIQEKRKKGNEFSIITLVLKKNANEIIKIPELLESYVWKEPKNDLIAIKEILLALPIKLSNIILK